MLTPDGPGPVTSEVVVADGDGDGTGDDDGDDVTEPDDNEASRVSSVWSTLSMTGNANVDDTSDACGDAKQPRETSDDCWSGTMSTTLTPSGGWVVVVVTNAEEFASDDDEDEDDDAASSAPVPVTAAMVLSISFTGVSDTSSLIGLGSKID